MSLSNDSEKATTPSASDPSLLNQSGKNSSKVVCAHCSSIIIQDNIAQLVDNRSFDLPLIYQKKEAPSLEKEALSAWWVVDDMFHFENVGFTNAHEGMKYLTCADCEIGPIGFVDLETKRNFVSLERVLHK
uniref:Guanine nucleotide exchange factor MSS4 n=1 Tax=Acrobeloides nanus TaxID=290746 RepID=A0A914CSH3_9BILA